jgi:hypothetical protein
MIPNGSDGTVIRTLLVEGRHSPDYEVEVKGTAAALRQLAALVALAPQSEEWRLSHDPKMNPAPYESWLESLTITRISGLVEIAVRGTQLTISGGNESLDLLAKNIRALADSGGGKPDHPPRHLHLEHHPGHLYLAPESRPLVVILVQ